MIEQQTIDKVMDAAQIVDVVSEFVTLRKRGVNYVGLCPFHSDKTPSFYVSPSKGVCKCFACGKGGNVVHFIMEHEQINYPDAIRWLAAKYGIEIKEKPLTCEEQQMQNMRESLFAINNFAKDYFQKTLHEHPDGKAIGMSYFRHRGIRDDIVRDFHLGYCTSSKDAMAIEAISKGYKGELLAKAGVCYKKEDGNLRDRFCGRVIFPWFNISGKIVGFGGRTLDSRTKGVNQKYINSPESEVFSKRRELYGIYQAKSDILKKDRVYMVEGYTDVIAMHQCGLKNVVSNSGTALSEHQVRLLYRFTHNITLLYDGDEAGIKASLRGIDILLKEGMNVKILLLPDGEDPDSFAKKNSASEFLEYIKSHETNFIRFKTDLLIKDADGDPVKHAELISDIAESIALIPNDIIRYACLRECASILNINEQVIQNEIKRHLLKRDSTYIENARTSSSQSVYSTLDPKQHLLYPSTSDTTEEESTRQENHFNYLSFIPKDGQEKLVFHAKEQALVKTIIRYGEQVMCYLEPEENAANDSRDIPLTVIEFVYSELKEDKIRFHDPLHQRILSEAKEHIEDPGFKAERYFLFHPEPSVSRMAAELVSDKYQLSSYHSKDQTIVPEADRLLELVPHQLLDFKIAILQEEMKHTLLKLKDKNIADNESECKKIMNNYIRLSDVMKDMAKQAGDKVVLR